MRGFVGFAVGEGFAAELAAFRERMPAEGLSFLATPDLHVTLKFLSEFSSAVFARALPEICALGPAPATALKAGKVALWPTVVALECFPCPELVRWHAELNGLLEAKGFLQERHPKFNPHVTLARVKRNDKVSPALSAWLEENGRAFEGRDVPLEAPALWQSQAEETGRRHRPFLSPLFARQR